MPNKYILYCNYFAIRFVYKMFLEEKINVKFVVYVMVNINVTYKNR